MNQPPKTDKRIVSKGAYAWVQARRIYLWFYVAFSFGCFLWLVTRVLESWSHFLVMHTFSLHKLLAGFYLSWYSGNSVLHGTLSYQAGSRS